MKKLILMPTALVSASEDFAGWYAACAAPITATYYNALDLDEIAPLAEVVAQTNAMLSVGSWTNRVDVSSPHDFIIVYESFSVSDYSNDYVASAITPSLMWFNEHRDDIENPDPSKVYFVGNRFVVRFDYAPYHDDKTLARVVDISDIDDFLTATEGRNIPWLKSDWSLDAYAERFGYTPDDEDKFVAVETAIVVYYMALLQKFPDPKQVVTHFCGKELTAELLLKGVFNDITVE